MLTLLEELTKKVNLIFEKIIPLAMLSLIARLAIASVFWRSVQTKINGGMFLGQSWEFYNINPITFTLFAEEYKVPLLSPVLSAYMATLGEFFFSLAIALGFATRLSALGLLGMTCVIQFFVLPEGWPTHMLWAAILLYLIKFGAGFLSVDYFIKKCMK
jgi:putative oxidoreductase